MDPLDVVAQLARAERGSLVRIARGEGATAEDAVDCVQEGLCTMLRLAQKGELPEAREEWPPLLGGIVRNAARNHRRRHHRARPHASLEMLGDGGAIPTDDVAGDVLLAAAEEHVRLRACVDRLCDTQRSVVMMRMLEERAGEDVAAELGISRGHVDVLLHRAKKALRACMLEGEGS